MPFGLALNWSSETLLLAACIGLVVVYFLLGGVRFLNDCATVRIGQGMVNDLRRDLYSRIQRLSLSFHTRQQVGDLMYRITADTMCIQALTMNGFFSILSASVLLVGMFVVMLSLDTSLTFLALAVCPALFVPSGFLIERCLSAAQARQKESLVYSLVQRSSRESA